MIPPKPKNYTRLDPFKTPATISAVKHYFEDHVGQMTSYVFCDYDDGGTQGFGGLALGKRGEKLERMWEQDILKLFGVKKLDEIVGKRCYVLRSFDECSATMEGLEADSGKRLTIRGFVKRHLGIDRDPLDQATENLTSSIAMHERRVAEDKIKLRNLKKGYKSWEE